MGSQRTGHDLVTEQQQPLKNLQSKVIKVHKKLETNLKQWTSTYFSHIMIAKEIKEIKEKTLPTGVEMKMTEALD